MIEQKSASYTHKECLEMVQIAVEVQTKVLKEAFDLLGEYFDIHRHDSTTRGLQRRTEELLYGPPDVPVT